MSDAPHRIWAIPAIGLWNCDQEDEPGEVSYILATPAALAASPEVQAMIREAEARAVDRYEMAIRKRFFGVKGFAWTAPDARDEAIAAIRAEAAALKGETT